MAETEKRVVQGEDIIIHLDGNPTFHATTHSLKVDLEMKEIRTKDTNGKEKSPGDISWSVDGDGLVVIDPNIGDSLSAEQVLDLVLAKKEVTVTLLSPKSGLTKKYGGKGYITSFSLSTPAGDNATYNYSIAGSGDLTTVQ